MEKMLQMIVITHRTTGDREGGHVHQSINHLFANEYNTIHEKKHNEYAIGKTYKAHRALTVALN